jgi:site-specific DNA-methyltransferase (adenine-specific)
MQEFENKIINADCMDILKQLPDKCVDLVLTDPPYGIGIDGQKKCKCKNPKHNRKEHQRKEWDSSIPPKEIFDEMKRVSKNMIVWGANYFNEYLEQGHKGWIVWDKGQDGLTMSDCELAYSTFDSPTRIFRMNRVELLKDGTIHPTQKPLRLFQRCVAEYSNENDLVLDCFSGSGTTAIACHNLKRRFICIEKDKDYYEASVKRLEDAQKQLNLF